jgi:hypothetical protein
MSIAAIADLDEAQIAKVSAAHPGAFATPMGQAKRWAPLVLAVVYVLVTMWYFEFAWLLDASERVWALLRNFVIWRDMETWAYRQIYVGIAQTLATLRANKRETIDWLKFTLECAGERTDGHAFTDAGFAECRDRQYDTRRHSFPNTCPRCLSAGGPHGRADEHAEAAQFHGKIQAAHSG